MSNETHHKTAKSNFEPLRATRRTALRGAGLAGLLALGGGSATASENTSEANIHGAETEMSADDEIVPVTWENYCRAQTDTYFESYVELAGLGEFYHYREPVPIDEQVVQFENRDVLPSIGIFDLTDPVTITKPDTGNRYQSMHVLNQDQYTKAVINDPGEYTLTRAEMGTRYVQVRFRTFVDPTDPVDIRDARRVQDPIAARQDSTGTFEVPTWDPESLALVREALLTLATQYTLTEGQALVHAFGDVEEVDPVEFLLGCAGWGALPASENYFYWTVPEQNDGETPQEMVLEDVPVDGFWSVSVYNGEGYFEANEYDAYSINSENAERDDDGSVTIRFGGDPDRPNFLYTPEDWSYGLRLYEPRNEVLSGFYQLPEPQPIE